MHAANDTVPLFSEKTLNATEQWLQAVDDNSFKRVSAQLIPQITSLRNKPRSAIQDDETLKLAIEGIVKAITIFCHMPTVVEKLKAGQEGEAVIFGIARSEWDGVIIPALSDFFEQYKTTNFIGNDAATTEIARKLEIISEGKGAAI